MTGEPSSDRLNPDTGDMDVAVGFLRHQPGKMAEATGRFEAPALLEAEPLERGRHSPIDDGRGVMSVQRVRESWVG